MGNALITKKVISVDSTDQSKTLVIAKSRSWAELSEHFLHAQEVAESSRATYTRQIRQFIVWLAIVQKESCVAVTRDDIIAFRDYLSSKRKSNYTIGGYITVVRKFFEWLESEKICPNTARGIKSPKKSRGFRKDCLTVEQVKKVLAGIDRTTLIGLRNYALVNLLVRTGLRTIEVSRARIEDLRQESGEAVLWIQGKGRDSKDDFVVLVEETLGPVREYLSRREKWHESDPLFGHSNSACIQPLTTRMISGIVKSSLRAVGLNDKRLSAHSLRHTAISLSIKGGASLVQAQAMARHTDPKTTMVYFHNQARVKAGAERFIKI